MEMHYRALTFENLWRLAEAACRAGGAPRRGSKAPSGVARGDGHSSASRRWDQAFHPHDHTGAQKQRGIRVELV